MRFVCTVELVETGYVEIEAPNEAEARERANDAYYMGDICWDDSEHTITDIERL